MTDFYRAEGTSGRPGFVRVRGASTRYSADALRLELNKWRQPVRTDDKVKALREAGKAARNHH